jgi:acyl-coenzyme A thioesterase PaaI-like protein
VSEGRTDPVVESDELHNGSSDYDGASETLAFALRRLMNAAVVTGADDDRMLAVAAQIDTLTATLSGPDGELLREQMPWPEMSRLSRGDRAHNPVVGRANPLAPPMWVKALPDNSVVSEITMGVIHEGPAGALHGGWVASLLDQLLGAANTVAHQGGMTAELTIRYRRATPVGVPLTLRARTDSSDGRRIYASGEIVADGVVTAEAKGLFIRPSTSTMDKLKASQQYPSVDG